MPPRIVVAPNAFKESLSATDAARALERGLRAALPHADVRICPLSDGGDGVCDVLVAATGGEKRSIACEDPLGRPLDAEYGLLGGEKEGAAVVEMAAASGLRLLQRFERDPMKTSTRGTGRLMRAAIEAGARRLVVGIGGSATVDGGTGMAQALGFEFFDANDRPIERMRGGTLGDLRRIDPAAWRAWREERGAPVEILVASDVKNVLLGEEGAARVYGPQKGASEKDVEELEAGLENLADVLRRDLGCDVRGLAGGGAAGGLGAGLVAFCGAEIRSGAETVAELAGLDDALAGADWLITAEGRIDGQTRFGKAPAEAARRAKARGVRVVGVAGSLGEGADELLHGDFDALFSICDGPMDLDDALHGADRLLERLGRSLGGLL